MLLHRNTVLQYLLLGMNSKAQGSHFLLYTHSVEMEGAEDEAEEEAVAVAQEVRVETAVRAVRKAVTAEMEESVVVAEAAPPWACTVR